jgi:hypothetical protein
MRVMHLSNDGLAVVECAVDGSGVTTRSIPADKMEKQRQLARFEYVFKQNPSVNQWQAPYEVVKLVPVPTPAGVKREDDVARALEKAFAESGSWKSEAVAVATGPTPSVPSVPTPTSSVPSVLSVPLPTPSIPLLLSAPGPTPSAPSILSIPAPTPAVEPPKPSPSTMPGTVVAERGRMMKCPHCGQTFFLPDDR